MCCSENVCVHISESSEELPTDSRRHLAYTHTCNDTSYSQHTCTTVSVNDRRAEYCDERVCLSVYTHSCNDTSYSQTCTTVSVNDRRAEYCDERVCLSVCLSTLTPAMIPATHNTPVPPCQSTIGERSIVMSGSVCLSVYIHTCNDTSYSQHTCTTVSVNDRRAEYCDERVCLSVCLHSHLQ